MLSIDYWLQNNLHMINILQDFFTRNPRRFHNYLYVHFKTREWDENLLREVCKIKMYRDEFPEEVSGEVSLVRHGIAHVGPTGELVTIATFQVPRAAGQP